MVFSLRDMPVRGGGSHCELVDRIRTQLTSSQILYGATSVFRVT